VAPDISFFLRPDNFLAVPASCRSPEAARSPQALDRWSLRVTRSRCPTKPTSACTLCIWGRCRGRRPASSSGAAASTVSIPARSSWWVDRSAQCRSSTTRSTGACSPSRPSRPSSSSNSRARGAWPAGAAWGLAEDGEQTGKLRPRRPDQPADGTHTKLAGQGPQRLNDRGVGKAAVASRKTAARQHSRTSRRSGPWPGNTTPARLPSTNGRRRRSGRWPARDVACAGRHLRP
jgi:hypothetical protein